MYKNKKIIGIITARGGSKGLPGKNIRILNGKPLIAWSVIEGQKSKFLDRLIVSTDSKEIAEVAKECGAEVPFMRPKELALDNTPSVDVLLHALNFLEKQGEAYDYLVSLEPTSPLRTVEDIDEPLRRLIEHNSAKAIVSVSKLESAHPDFVVSVNNEGLIKPFLGGDELIVKRRQELNDVYFPDGTIYISEVDNLKQKKTFYHKLTLAYPVERYKSFEVDEEMDIIIIEALMKYRESKGGLKKMEIKKGVELWNEAKKIIPGGSQLLSKRSEMFLPDQWPSYYKKAKGVEIWDLDDNKFVDMSIMGVGACILGYADADVNNAVKEAIDAGSMTTLNCPEEIELAELLLKLNPWAGGVRYARTGGEAMAVAVRIARAYTKKDKVAFCGYHGWHDWYLSANLADDKNLDGHLLPGLEPSGVPRCLKGTAIPFEYNKIEQLKKIVKENNDIGVIVIEPIRHQEPKNDFLKKVRELAKEIGAVLIFDEITSGFRLCIGGAYEKYNVHPDIVVYAKAMSNGYPMAAVVGRKEVMDAAQSSFISSAYWTERVGLVAAIATINKMIKNNVPEHLVKIGNLISEGWKELAKKYNLDIKVVGIPPLTTFIIQHKESQALHTLFTQEMLNRSYLASKSVYVSYCHTEEIIEKYLKNVDEVFEIISKAIKNKNVHDLLKGPVAHSGFRRLT